MNTHRMYHRLVSSAVAATMIAGSIAVPFKAYAQADNGLTFEFQPHCEDRENDPDSCTTFDVRDPESLQTDILSIGDTLDIDLVIKNPDRVPVSRFRAWAAYDPTILNGVDVEISEDFPTPTPGEDMFDSETGYIKLSGSTDDTVDDEEILVARLTMEIADARIDGTPIIFFDDTRTEDLETGIFTRIGAGETSVGSPTHGYLFVRIEQEEEDDSSSSSSSATSAMANDESSSSESSVAASTDQTNSTVFTLLQVQGVRVTTEGSSAFLAWDTLPSSDLVGYNIYYGTISGKYIQKRSVDSAANSITIRALPIGSFYYFAVRGVNAAGQETEFSQEVAVGIGDPSSSTSPLLAGSIPTGTPSTNGNVAGDTGPVSTLLFFVIACAFAGTIIAFRRQLIATDSTNS